MWELCGDEAIFEDYGGCLFFMDASPATDGWDDVTHTFWRECAALDREFVHVEEYALVHLMNAIEVMDPIMDAGMACPPCLLPEAERVPPSDAPFSELGWRDVCWVLDRLAACELEWLHGASLVQTMYTCRFFHEHVLSGVPARAHWSHSVLSAYVLAAVKCCAIQWTELAKQHVLDQEDYCSETGGTAFPDAHDASSIGRQLDQACALVQDTLEAAAAEAVCTRILFRKHWLLCVEGMTRSVPHGVDSSMHLDACVRLWRQIDAGACPLHEVAMAQAPTHLHTFFDVSLSRALSSHIPMRPLALPTRTQTQAKWLDILTRQMPLPLRLLASDDVLAWHALLACSATTYERDAPIPFIRSLIQSLVSSGYTTMGGTHDATYLATSLVEAWQPVCAQDVLVRLEWHDQRSAPSALASALAHFLQRLGATLAQTLCTYTQNRARQKRSFGKAFPAWMDLLDQAASLQSRVADAVRVPDSVLTGPVAYVTLVHMEHAIGCGFDLELYHAEERACMYWLLSKVYGEMHALTHAQPGSAWQCVAHAAKAQQELCTALSILLAQTYGDTRRAQAAFSRRVKWLRRPRWCAPARLALSGDAPFHVDEAWSEFEAWHKAAVAAPLSSVAAMLSTAVASARAVADLRASDPSALLCRRERRTLDQHLLDTVVGLHAAVCAGARVAPDAWIPSACPWYCTLRTNAGQ